MGTFMIMNKRVFSAENPDTIYPDGYRKWVISIRLIADSKEGMEITF
jgi:hypothetical protein